MGDDSFADEAVGSDEDYGIAPYSASIGGTYGVGTSNLSLFGGFAGKLYPWVHYVYYRTGQYTYVLAYGEGIAWNGTQFVADSVETLTYNTYTGSTSQATFVHGTENSWYVPPLGPYPELVQRGGNIYELAACLLLASFALFGLWRSLRSSLRERFVSG